MVGSLVMSRSVGLIPAIELNQALVDILRNASVISENSVIEFKVAPHSKDYDTELFKDVLGLANSYERPEEDRWLIYGVDNKTRTLIGVNQDNPDLLDDANYRQKFKKIKPYLHVEFLTIPARSVDESFESEKVFAAFYIPCECMNEIHEIGQCVSDKEGKNGKIRKLSPGASFVRFGSSTESLFEHHRVEIRKLIEGYRMQPFHINEAHENVRLAKSADVLLLLGSWDEANKADRTFLTAASGEPYLSAVKELQSLLDDGFFSMRESRWVIADRAKGIGSAGKHLTKSALLALAKPFGAMLSSVDMAYDLLPDERIMADVRNTNRGCSRALRESVVIFCAQIGNNPDLLPQCSQNDIDHFLSEIMRSVFQAEDWRVLASAEDFMPLLAEASPVMYLNYVRLCSDTDAFKKFMQEKTGGFASVNLGGGLVRGIRVAAMAHDMLSRAISVLVKISDDTDLAKSAITDLLLPWYPSTDASVESRKGIGKYLSKQSNEAAWQALMALLPGKTTSTFGVVEPTYMSHPERPEGVLMSEYWEVSRAYCCQALEAARGNTAKLLDVISDISCYKTAGLINEFCDTVSVEAQSLSADDHYKVWNQLSSYVQWCEKFSDAEWVPSSEVLEKIKELTNQLKPSDPFYLALRLCSIHDWDLIGDEESFTEGEERVAHLRADAIRGLYEYQGIDIANVMIEKGAKGNALGVAIALLDISSDDEQAICSFIDNSDTEKMNLVRAYVGNNFVRKGWAWVDSLEMSAWPKERIASFYSFLPLSKDAWSRAEKLLGDDASLYWRRAPSYGIIKDLSDLSYYVERLLEVDRAADALDLLEGEVREGVAVNADLVKKTLNSLHVESIDSMLAYYIEQLFEYLETFSCDDELFFLELRFTRLLHDKSKCYLYRRMTEDPGAFLLIASVAYNLGLIEEKDLQISKDVRLAFVFQILYNWKTAPGYDSDGNFDEQIFHKWIEGARNETEDERALEHIDREIGHVLFYSKPEGNFFLPEAVAEFIENNEAALSGYQSEIFNSRGVFTVDPTGAPEDELADKYEQKAAEAEAMGYLSIAVVMRSIACSYRDEAERRRNETWD